MLKEIHEQPRGAPPVARRPGRRATAGSTLDELDGARGRAPARSTRVELVACGTASLRGARRGAPRSRTGPGCRPGRPSARSSATARRRSTRRRSSSRVTQSGETADTIAPTRCARERGCPIIAVTNTVGSAITREADAVLFLQAGPEIAVAASKTFVTQVTTLVVLAAAIAKAARHAGRGSTSSSSVDGAARAARGRPAGRSTRAAAIDRSSPAATSTRAASCSSAAASTLPGRARGRAQAQGGQLRPRRGLRGRRAQARPDLAARRRVPAGRGRDPLARSTTS